jgi:hypothetical protein
MTTSIIDVAQDTTSNIVHLQADNIGWAIRYLTTNTASEKLIRAAEARALAAAGIRLGLVFETGGGAPHQPPLTAAQGQIDGAFAAKYAPTVGAPPGACIYFAADNDFNQQQIGNEILPYFQAVYMAMKGSGFRVGVYGSGAVCKSVINAVFADLAWLSGSMGWSGSREYLAARPSALVLVQTTEDAKYAGMDVDFDEALGDWGDFLPFAASPTIAPAVVASAAPAPTPATEPQPETLAEKIEKWL